MKEFSILIFALQPLHPRPLMPHFIFPIIKNKQLGLKASHLNIDPRPSYFGNGQRPLKFNIEISSQKKV